MSRLRMLISVYCVHALLFPACCKGRAQRMLPHHCSECHVEHKEVLNGKKTMHACGRHAWMALFRLKMKIAIKEEGV